MAKHKIKGIEDQLPPNPNSAGGREASIGAITQHGSRKTRSGSKGSGGTASPLKSVYEGRGQLGRPHTVKTRFKGKPGA